MQWAPGWTELHLPLVPSPRECNWDPANPSCRGQLSPGKAEKRMQRGQRGASGRVRMLGKWIGGTRSFSAYLLPSPQTSWGRCCLYLTSVREWWTRVASAVRSLLCGSGLHSVVASAAAAPLVGRKAVLGAPGARASCQTVFAEPARKGKPWCSSLSLCQTEWDFMRQRKGTSPPAGLLIKGLLHTMEVGELFISEVTVVL